MDVPRVPHWGALPGRDASPLRDECLPVCYTPPPKLKTPVMTGGFAFGLLTRFVSNKPVEDWRVITGRVINSKCSLSDILEPKNYPIIWSNS